MNIFDQIGSAFASDFVSGPTVNPQYQPPQRTWVGLTDDERLQIYLKSNGIEFYKNFAMNIEAKLKEKNT